MKELPALETFVDCKVKPTKEIHITFNMVSTLSTMQSVMNSKWIGVILYCIYCKEPLNYSRENGEILFRCPKCNTKWVKSVTWERDSGNG